MESSDDKSGTTTAPRIFLEVFDYAVSAEELADTHNRRYSLVESPYAVKIRVMIDVDCQVFHLESFGRFVPINQRLRSKMRCSVCVRVIRPQKDELAPPRACHNHHIRVDNSQ